MGKEEELLRAAAAAAGFLPDEPGGDPGRDDEAPHWPFLRVRQAPTWHRTHQGTTKCDKIRGKSRSLSPRFSYIKVFLLREKDFIFRALF